VELAAVAGAGRRVAYFDTEAAVGAPGDIGVLDVAAFVARF
jgi:hypothetical protein